MRARQRADVARESDIVYNLPGFEGRFVKGMYIEDVDVKKGEDAEPLR